jgi:hypothetical protein
LGARSVGIFRYGSSKLLRPFRLRWSGKGFINRREQALRSCHTISASNYGRIREFHSKLYDAPPPDAPLIQEITIISADEEPTT